MTLEAIKWRNGQLQILDQLLLPGETKYIDILGVKDGWNAIHKMQVRGAPAIAIVGALSLAVEIQKKSYSSTSELLEDMKQQFDYLITARPTAVNIKLAAGDILLATKRLCKVDISVDEMKEKIILLIAQMLEKDRNDNLAVGDYGAQDILSKYPDKSVSILTHCNTGSLATAGYGTALGIIRSLHKLGRLEHAYCTETRPYNQGARLTAYELVYEKIPATLICDDMVAWLMKSKNISAVVVGADRVVANGDTANKIGTYQLAVLAKHHGVSFYVAAPYTSIDFSIPSGDKIRIEERPHNEMTYINSVRIAAEGINCWNPAFDVTPAELITGIVTEKGVFKPDCLSKQL